MAKSTKSKKTSWKAKAMGALALAAVFGLPMGTAAATDVPDGAWSETTIGDGDAYKVTGKATSANGITMDGGTLDVGNLIFNIGAITGLTQADGDLAIAAAKKLAFTGGKIIANTISIGGSTESVLDLTQGGTPLSTPQTLTLRIGGTASEADNSISAKTLNYYATTSMKFQQTTIELMNGGKFNAVPVDIATAVNSGFYGSDLNSYYDRDPNTDGVQSLSSSLIMTGGEFNMKAPDSNQNYGRLFSFSNIDISGGTVNIGGRYAKSSSQSSKYETSTMYGDMGDNAAFTIRDNAVVNLYDYGTIAAWAGDAADKAINPNMQFALDIKGGTINILGTNGKASMIRTSSVNGGMRDSYASTGIDGKINISGGKINVGADKYGVLVSQEINMSGGTLSVAGKIMAAGDTLFDDNADLMASIVNTSKRSSGSVYGQMWGDFNLSGGTIDIADTGLIDFATGNMRLNAKGGALNGKLALANGSYAGGTTANMPDTLATGTLWANEVYVDAGKNLTVNALHLDSKAIADALVVNGALIVDGVVTTSASLTNDGVIDIKNGGSLSVDYAEVLTDAFALQSDNAGLTKALKDSLGTIYLNAENGFKYTIANLESIANVLLGAKTKTTQIVLNNATLVDASGDALTEVTASDSGGTGKVNAPTSTTATDVAISTSNTTTEFEIENDFQAKTVQIDNNNLKTVTIDSAIISGAGNSSDKPLVANGTGGAVNVTVAANKALTLGAAAKAAEQQGGTVGDIAFSNAGILNVNDGDFKAGDITAKSTGAVTIAVNNSGTSTSNATTTLTAEDIDLSASTNAAEVTVANSNLKANGDIKFGNNSNNTMKVTGGTIEAAKIIGNSSNPVKITVGDASKAGQLVAASVENADIILDPAWGTDSTTAILGSISKVNVGVLQNSWLSLAGSRETAQAEAWMKAQIPGGKLDENTYTAAMAIFAPYTLTDGNWLVVDGSKDNTNIGTPSADTAEFAAKSLLLVNAAGFKATDAVLTNAGTGAATVDTTAALKIVGGKAGQTIQILDNFTNAISAGWGCGGDATTLLTDSALLKADIETNTAGDFTVKMTRNDIKITTIFPEVSGGMAGMVESILTNAADDGTNAGISFFSKLFRGIDPDHAINEYGINATEAARTLEGAARIAAVAGVPTLASGLSAQVSNLVVDHNSMLNAAQPAYGSEPGQIGLWLTPFYRSSDVDGMEAGAFENAYELNYGGAAFGLDYNFSESFRLGLALNAGGGDSETQGGGKGFNKTENDFDFWGLSLYGSYTNGAFGLTADAGYTSLDNEITQDVPYNRLKADGGSDLFTLGLTGEYRVTTDSGFAVTPHAGLRYTSISTDDSLLKAQDGSRILDVATDDQNLFQIPLGVKFGKDIATDGGWTVTPTADLGVLFTMGDTDVDSKATISGTPYSGVTNTEVVDKAAFTAALGLEAKADSGLTLGLEYGLLASGNQTGHSVNGLLRFDF